MIFVFNQNGIDINCVGIGLAAWCVVPYLLSKTDISVLRRELRDTQTESEASLRATIRERLNGEPMKELPTWAYEILATFLHAWLMDSHGISGGFRTIF